MSNEQSLLSPYRCEICDYFIGKMENCFGCDQPFCKNPKIIQYNKNKPETGGQIDPSHWRIEDHYIMEKDLYFHAMSNGEVEGRRVLGCVSHSAFKNECNLRGEI
jgi:hypothetical protein